MFIQPRLFCIKLFIFFFYLNIIMFTQNVPLYNTSLYRRIIHYRRMPARGLYIM
jgi:hypothetical protein